MTEQNIQKPGLVMQSPEPSDWRSRVRADGRQRIVKRVTWSLMLLPQSNNSSEAEKAARQFEEKVFSIASNLDDYLKRIALKCTKIRSFARSKASKFPVVSSTTNGPTSILSVSEVAACVDAEDLPEYMYQWILDMRDKYLAQLEEELPVIDRWLKELRLRPHAKRKFERIMCRLKKIISFLSFSREHLVRVKLPNKEILDVWEREIGAQIHNFHKIAGAFSSRREKQDHQKVKSERIELTGNEVDSDLLSHSPQKKQRLLPQEQSRVYPVFNSLPLLTSGDAGNNNQSTAILPYATPSRLSEYLNINVGSNSENISPIHRLVNAVSSISSHTSTSAVKETSSVLGLIDAKGASALVTGTTCALEQDLLWTRGCSMPSKSPNLQQNTGGTCYPRQFINEMSTKESTTKRIMNFSTTEAAHRLMQEIEDIKILLIDTTVKILPVARGRQHDSDVMMVECCFEGVSVNSSLIKYMKLQGMSTTIHPLRLFIPVDYPGGAPIFVNDLKCATGEECKDLTLQANLRFGMHLVGVKNRLSLKDIAVMWDYCCREVFAEYARKNGGGNFSSTYCS